MELQLSEKQIAAVKVELAKIFTLAAEGISASMFSGSIDAVWHEMLNDTDYYRAFCLKSCGYSVTHRELAGCGEAKFVKHYEFRYGPLPEIWFVGEDGVLNTEQRDYYLKTGKVFASWNCNPVVTGLEDIGFPEPEDCFDTPLESDTKIEESTFPTSEKPETTDCQIGSFDIGGA